MPKANFEIISFEDFVYLDDKSSLFLKKKYAVDSFVLFVAVCWKIVALRSFNANI